MRVADALLDLAAARNARGLAVVGIAKNVGKTVTVRALLQAAYRRGMCVGITSVGRDGERIDAVDAEAKPRLLLEPGTIVATAASALPQSPASEILERTAMASALGAVAVVRVRSAAFYEIVGAPSATGARESLERLRAHGADVLLLDGAVDRIAALAGGSEGIVVAVGAAGGATIAQVALDARGLVRRLQVPAYNAEESFVRVDGALTAQRAAAFLQSDDRRQIVVRDPTQIVLDAKSFALYAERLTLRCERALQPIAVTVASIGRERRFEPAAFARAVASAVELPVFDVYAGAAA
jgi:hypothetical protein